MSNKVKYLIFLTFIFSSCGEPDYIEIPNIETLDITEITDSSAIGGGIIISDGGSKILKNGVCWDTISNPTIIKNINKTEDQTGNKKFISQIVNLKPNKKYYVKAYAVNQIGINYGNEISFTTKGRLPIIVVSGDIYTSYFYANIHSSLISDGGMPITQLGVCWSTHINPTISDFIELAGLNSINFICEIKNLQPNTTYYLRAFATNDMGTGYSNSVSFTTKSYEQVTDIDGNVYRTALINNKTWFIENLRVTHYSNGDPIPNIPDNNQWKVQKAGAYCYYNNLAGNSIIYGNLYNWFTVDDPRGLCPTGWHVASAKDYKDLLDYLGGAAVAGGKMKIIDTDPHAEPRWDSPNTGATNESGYTGLPGGFRDLNGNYQNINLYGFWWESDEKNSVQGGYLTLKYKAASADTAHLYKPYGCSVRCVKD